MCGKGDRIRPFDPKKWDNNWRRIFGCKHCEGPCPCKYRDCDPYKNQGDKNDSRLRT